MNTVSQKLQNASHSPHDKGLCITCQFDVCLSPQLDCELCEYKERCVHSSKPESRTVFDTVLSKQLSKSEGISESSCFMQQLQEVGTTVMPTAQENGTQSNLTLKDRESDFLSLTELVSSGTEGPRCATLLQSLCGVAYLTLTSHDSRGVGETARVGIHFGKSAVIFHQAASQPADSSIHSVWRGTSLL